MLDYQYQVIWSSGHLIAVLVGHRSSYDLVSWLLVTSQTVGQLVTSDHLPVCC